MPAVTLHAGVLMEHVLCAREQMGISPTTPSTVPRALSPPSSDPTGDNALCMGAAEWGGARAYLSLPVHWPLGHRPQLPLDVLRVPRVESCGRLGTAESGAWAGSHTLCTALQPCP